MILYQNRLFLFLSLPQMITRFYFIWNVPKAIRLIAIIVYMNRNNLECSYSKLGRVRLKKRYPNMKELNYIELSNVAYLCTYILHLYVANVRLKAR